MALPTSKTTAPFGAWRSIVSADQVAESATRVAQLGVDADTLYWIESRPRDNGRNVLVRRDADGRVRDVTGAEHSVRSRVHEYGGGAFAVRDGQIFFCNDADQRIYRIACDVSAAALTPTGPWRYADLEIHPSGRWLLAVREDHSGDGAPVNELVILDVDAPTPSPAVIASGCDFYASPRLAPDGLRLAWLSWNHPDMPWDATQLWLADFRDGEPARTRLVAGGPTESIFQPLWSPGGDLYYISDRSGWWNLCRDDGNGGAALLPMAAEFGQPQWVFGQSTCAFIDHRRLACAFTQDGWWSFGVLDIESGRFRVLDTPACQIDEVRALAGRAVFIAGFPDRAEAIMSVGADGALSMIREAPHTLAPDWISTPEAIEFPGDDATSHALFYPPRNPECAGLPAARPPLIVRCHGGPTAAASPALDLKVQFWTSRGFAVCDVDYAGSTGYGRAYRARLDGAWGVRDVRDCELAARFLAAQGRVDGHRMAIRGSSAGGFTALCALTFGNTFQAGTSLYGIGDLAAIARDTHKFEARYLDRLVAPWPDGRAIYHARSPLYHVQRLSAAALFLQGLEDPVVPPSQAEDMVNALRACGRPVTYVAFEGEQHGFRRADSIRRALEAELYFYRKVFALDASEDPAPITIENLIGAV